MNCRWLGLDIGSVTEQACTLILGAGFRLTRAPALVPIETGAVTICRRRATVAERTWGSPAGSRVATTGTGGPGCPRPLHGRERYG